MVTFFENLASPATIDIRIDAKPNIKFLKAKIANKSRKLPVFMGDDSISGQVELKVAEEAEIEHFGVKVYLLGLLGKLEIIQRFIQMRAYQLSFIPSPKS